MDQQEQVLKYVNRYRRKHGKAPLSVNRNLTKAAEQHNQRMIENNRLDHQLRGELSLSERLIAVGYGRGSWSCAENIAQGYPTAKAVVEGWISSPGHERNLLGDYSHTGIAYGGNSYWTQVFGRN